MGNKSRVILMMCSFIASFGLIISGVYVLLFEARKSEYLLVALIFFVPSALLFWNYCFLKIVSVTGQPQEKGRVSEITSLWLDVKTAELRSRLEKETDK